MNNPGTVTEGMYPCRSCPINADTWHPFDAETAAAVNTEVARQMSGDSLRTADDPTPIEIIRCAAFVAISICGNFTQNGQVMRIKGTGRRVHRVRPGQVEPYL